MEPLGRFPRVLNGVPRENIEGPLRPDPRPKTRGAAGPEGFWPRVWPRMWPRICLRKIPRAFNLPQGVDWVLKGPPEGTDSPGYPWWLFHRLSFFLNSARVDWVLRHSTTCNSDPHLTFVCLFNLSLGNRLEITFQNKHNVQPIGGCGRWHSTAVCCEVCVQPIEGCSSWP